MSTSVISSELKQIEGFENKDLEALDKLLEIRDVRLDFATNYHVNTRGEAMDFAHYPHIVQLYNTTAAEIVLMGSVQSFKSEFSIIDHFAAAYVGLSIFFVLPKFEMRTTYVQNRINRCVESVPHYKKIIGNGFFDSVAMKNFGRGVVKYVGSNVLSDFKEFPADMMVVEEVDGCSPENVEFALDRLRASKYQFKRYLGNPRVRGKGIHKYFLRSNQQEWYAPCLQCGKKHELDWFNTVVQDITDKNGNIVDYQLRDEKWIPGCRRDINCICPDCGGVIERASQNGEWIAKHPENMMEGMHISMLCSTLNSVSGMYDRFRRALNDPGLYKQFFNSDLGLPYNAAGNRVTETVLDRCVDEDFEVKILPDRAHVASDSSPGPCSMGIDVGSNLDVRISKLDARGGRRLVFVGKIRSHNVYELHELIERYNVEKAVMDSGPEYALAQDFQDDSTCDTWLCHYGAEGGDRRRTFNIHDRVITIDRTEALDRSYAHLRMKKVVLPKNYSAILKGEFSAEMCLPVRQVTEDKKGNSRYEWTKGKDHQRHADTYDMLAADLLKDAVLDDVSFG
jgi:hypothetical protein